MSDNVMCDNHNATKCDMYNELLQELNFISLFIIFHKLSLNISLINSLRITNIAHFAVKSFSSNSFTILMKL